MHSVNSLGLGTIIIREHTEVQGIKAKLSMVFITKAPKDDSINVELPEMFSFLKDRHGRAFLRKGLSVFHW